MILQRLRDALWIGIAVVIGLFLLLPMLLVIVFSFDELALTSLPLTGFTLDWYIKLVRFDYFWPALKNSVLIGVLVSVISVVNGTWRRWRWDGWSSARQHASSIS